MRSRSAALRRPGRTAWFLFVVVMAAVAVVSAQVAAQPAAASTVVSAQVAAQSAASTVLQLRHTGTQLCLFVPGLRSEVQLALGVCNSANQGQRWVTFRDFGQGTKFIPEFVPTTCLNVRGSSAAIGAAVGVSDCAADLSQDWFLVSTTVPTNGSFVLMNRNSGLCLNTSLGGVIEQNTCDLAATTQTFQVLTV
jgi:hypothetical protein